MRSRLPEIIKAATRRRGTTFEPAPEPDEPDFPRPAVNPLGGCFRAAVMLAMFLLLAFLTMSLLVGGSMMQFFYF